MSSKSKVKVKVENLNCYTQIALQKSQLTQWVYTNADQAPREKKKVPVVGIELDSLTL